MATSWSVLTEDVIRDHETVRRAEPIGVTVRGLQMRGLTATEAASLAGRLAGLHGVRGGWTIRQVEHLVFLRAIVESGRLAG
jgi:hypothetical protein